MPVYSVCQKFFRGALAPFHQYRQNALLDATVAVTCEASLTLTNIGRYLPGTAQVKNKIKRVGRLWGTSALHRDIPLIFRNITSLFTRKLPWCVIAVDWSGYPSQEYHVLCASLLCDGRSIPLISPILPSKKQNDSLAQKAFINDLAAAIPTVSRVTIATDAGFRCSWFHQVRELRWDFVGRVRGAVYFRLNNDEQWRQLKDLSVKPSTEYLGYGV